MMMTDRSIPGQVGMAQCTAKYPVFSCSPSDSLDSEAFTLQTLPRERAAGYSTVRLKSQLDQVHHLTWSSLTDLSQAFTPPPSPTALPCTFFGGVSGLKDPMTRKLHYQPSSQTLGTCSRQSSACLINQPPTLGPDHWAPAQTPEDDFVLTPYSWVRAVQSQSARITTIPTPLREQPAWPSVSLSPVVSFSRGFDAPANLERSGSNHITPCLEDLPESFASRKRKLRDLDAPELHLESRNFSFFHQKVARPANSPMGRLGMSASTSRHRAHLPQPSSVRWQHSFPSAFLNGTLQTPVPALQSAGLPKHLSVCHSMLPLQGELSIISTPTLAVKRPRLTRPTQIGRSLKTAQSLKLAQTSRSQEPVQENSLSLLSMGLDRRLEKSSMKASCSADQLLAWGLFMKLSVASLSVAQSLCQRVKFEVKPKKQGSSSLDWNEVVTIVGCLWIASKLCERRQGLLTLTQLGQMISARTEWQIPNHVFVSFEIGIMQKVNWQPLQGCLHM